jgi:hypothetical protein
MVGMLSKRFSRRSKRLRGITVAGLNRPMSFYVQVYKNGQFLVEKKELNLLNRLAKILNFKPGFF